MQSLEVTHVFDFRPYTPHFLLTMLLLVGGGLALQGYSFSSSTVYITTLQHTQNTVYGFGFMFTPHVPTV